MVPPPPLSVEEEGNKNPWFCRQGWMDAVVVVVVVAGQIGFPHERENGRGRARKEEEELEARRRKYDWIPRLT